MSVCLFVTSPSAVKTDEQIKLFFGWAAAPRHRPAHVAEWLAHSTAMCSTASGSLSQTVDLENFATARQRRMRCHGNLGGRSMWQTGDGRRWKYRAIIASRGKTRRIISRDSMYTLPVAVAWSSSDDSAIRYVLPVWWMTSCFHKTRPVDQNQARLMSMFRLVRQMAAQGRSGYLRLQACFPH